MEASQRRVRAHHSLSVCDRVRTGFYQGRCTSSRAEALGTKMAVHGEATDAQDWDEMVRLTSDETDVSRVCGAMSEDGSEKNGEGEGHHHAAAAAIDAALRSIQPDTLSMRSHYEGATISN